MVQNNSSRFVAIVGISFAFMLPINGAFGESRDFKKLTAEWWQWALSIPTSVNPQLDTTGVNAAVGQRGTLWFLAGVFNGFNGSTATRTSFVPEGTEFFFPVINSVNINTPNVCRQVGNLSVSELRAMSAALIDGATNLSVTVDGVQIRKLRRVQSEVFAVALPEDNVFISPCFPLPVPASVYSPAVDDGFYVLLDPLPVGSHTLRFHAESFAGVLQQDITYNLTVVLITLK
jgi:hypothetical protein